MRQGRSKSHLLHVEAALRSLKTHCGGIGIPVANETLISFGFADNQIVLPQDEFYLEIMMKSLFQGYQK